jgi:hypothetical protein
MWGGDFIFLHSSIQLTKHVQEDVDDDEIHWMKST